MSEKDIEAITTGVDELGEDEEEEQDEEYPPLAREPSTPVVQKVLDELSLLGIEEQKEIFFGLQKILADAGFKTFIRKVDAQNLCSNCGTTLKGDFRRSGVGLCKQCLPVSCTFTGCITKLYRDWRWVGKCKEHGGYTGFPE